MVKCVEFFLGYWLFGVNQRWDGYPGGMGVETWQAPKCRFYHSFLGWWWLLDALSIQNMSFSMQSEHIHLWGFIETFQFNPWLKIWLLDAYDWLLAETNEALEILTVEFCTSCTTESIKRLHSLLLTFALSGWLTTRNFCLGLLQKYCFILGWLTYVFAVTLSSEITRTRMDLLNLQLLVWSPMQRYSNGCVVDLCVYWIIHFSRVYHLKMVCQARRWNSNSMANCLSSRIVDYFYLTTMSGMAIFQILE